MTPSDPREADSLEYRSLSPLAVAALVVGAVALVGLLVPAAWPVALAGTLLGWGAARSVRANPETRTGLGLALVGLALSAVTLGSVVARGAVADRLHGAEAERVVTEFVARLSRDDVVGAYELTQEFDSRQPTAEAAEAFYEADAAAAEKLVEFRDSPTVAVLNGATGGGVVERTASAAEAGGRVVTRRVVEVVPAGEGAAPKRVAITAERTPRRDRLSSSWRVTGFDPAG